jgi:hypothetical protein
MACMWALCITKNLHIVSATDSARMSTAKSYAPSAQYRYDVSMQRFHHQIPSVGQLPNAHADVLY